MVNYGHYKTVLLLLWGQWRYAAYACTIDRGWAGPPGPKLDETDFRITRRQFCSHNLSSAGLCQMVTDGQSVDQLVYSQQRTRIYKIMQEWWCQRVVCCSSFSLLQSSYPGVTTGRYKRRRCWADTVGRDVETRVGVAAHWSPLSIPHSCIGIEGSYLSSRRLPCQPSDAWEMLDNIWELRNTKLQHPFRRVFLDSPNFGCKQEASRSSTWVQLYSVHTFGPTPGPSVLISLGLGEPHLFGTK